MVQNEQQGNSDQGRATKILPSDIKNQKVWEKPPFLPDHPTQQIQYKQEVNMYTPNKWIIDAKKEETESLHLCLVVTLFFVSHHYGK